MTFPLSTRVEKINCNNLHRLHCGTICKNTDSNKNIVVTGKWWRCIERDHNHYKWHSFSTYLSFHIVPPLPKRCPIGANLIKDEHNFPDLFWVDNNYCGLYLLFILFCIPVYFVYFLHPSHIPHGWLKHPYV